MKKTFLTFIALIITGMISVPVMAQLTTRGIWTFDGGGRQLNDPELGCEVTTFEKFRMISAWTEPTPGYPAEAHWRGVAITFSPNRGCDNHFYEFTLIQTTVTNFNSIQGIWDVYRDGVLVCSSCTGSANGLIQPVTNYYKVTIDDPVYGSGAWFYSGFIDARDDF